MIRNDWRAGDWLMKDDESGLGHYRSQMKKNWDGTWRHHTNTEPIHPQYFVKPSGDPKPLKKIRPDRAYPTPDNIVPLTVGETAVLTRTGPATHLFDLGILGGDPGIGEMTIEASATQGPFMVR